MGSVLRLSAVQPLLQTGCDILSPMVQSKTEHIRKLSYALNTTDVKVFTDKIKFQIPKMLLGLGGNTVL